MEGKIEERMQQAGLGTTITIDAVGQGINFANLDCIDIEEFTKDDGTVVRAHKRCIDRVTKEEVIIPLDDFDDSGKALFKKSSNELNVAIERNNGNPMSLTQDGIDSKLYADILKLKEVNGDVDLANKYKAQVYSDNFKEWFGDWQGTEESTDHQLVPTEEVNEMSRGDINRSEDSLKELKEDIRKNGIKEPLVAIYNVTENKVTLREGHHRLEVAKQLGIKEVPLKIIAQWEGSFNEKGITQGETTAISKLDKTQYEERNYFPTFIDPSEIGFTNSSPSSVSKVVDENGEPLVVYHGSAADFDVFSKKYLGALTNTNISQLGFFFSNSKRNADQYAFIGGLKNPDLKNKLTEARPFFLNVKNPHIGEELEWENLLNWSSNGSRKYSSPTALKKANKEFKKKLLEEGRDGADFLNGLEIVVFEPNQIKSIFNSGSWSDDDNINK